MNELKELEELNQILIDKLDAANRRIAHLETSKFSIDKVLRRHNNMMWSLQIVKVINTPDGVVIEIEL